MNTTFSKVDPTCFKILPIRWNESPVESLSTININFQALDADICNLGFSATNFWNPMYTEFVSNSANWNAVYTTVRDHSACWQSTFLTVQDLSAAWLSPISIIYPFSIPKDSLDRTAMVDWVRSNFPVIEGSCVNYLNGQNMKLFTLEYVSASQRRTCSCGGSVSVRFIGIGTRSASCGCSCGVTCGDRYVDTIQGIELCVTNGIWQYVKDVY